VISITIKKMGRPKAENPLTNDIKVRLDVQTTKKLDEQCRESGRTRAAVIRDALREYLGITQEAMTDKQLEMILTLVTDKFEKCRNMDEVKKAVEQLKEMAEAD